MDSTAAEMSLHTTPKTTAKVSSPSWKMEWSTRAALGTTVASAPAQHHKLKHLEHKRLQQTCTAQQIMCISPETKKGNKKVSVKWSLDTALCFGMYDIMQHLR